MAKLNKSQYPIQTLADLAKECSWKGSIHQNDFWYTCTIISEGLPGKKLKVTHFESDRFTKPCAYIFVIDGKIFKYGAATTGMKSRIASYNAGTYDSASATNKWVLNSMLNLGIPARIFTHEAIPVSATCLGEIITTYAPSGKDIEKKAIKQFAKQFGRKPIGNTQG